MSAPPAVETSVVDLGGVLCLEEEEEKKLLLLLVLLLCLEEEVFFVEVQQLRHMFLVVLRALCLAPQVAPSSRTVFLCLLTNVKTVQKKLHVCRSAETCCFSITKLLELFVVKFQTLLLLVSKMAR